VRGADEAENASSLVAALRWVSAWAGVVGLSLSWSVRRAVASARASGSMSLVREDEMRSMASVSLM